MGFAGMEQDAVTGQNLAVYREENPGTGRWDSQDPLGFVGGSADLYEYAGNLPTDDTDPTGLDDEGYYQNRQSANGWGQANIPPGYDTWTEEGPGGCVYTYELNWSNGSITGKIEFPRHVAPPVVIPAPGKGPGRRPPERGRGGNGGRGRGRGGNPPGTQPGGNGGRNRGGGGDNDTSRRLNPGAYEPDAEAPPSCAIPSVYTKKAERQVKCVVRVSSPLASGGDGNAK